MNEVIDMGGIGEDVAWADVAEASATKSKEPRSPRNFSQVLGVKLTADEKAAIAAQVAALDLKRDEQEAAKKQASDKAKAEIELTETQMKELLACYRKGAVDREVECLETFLFDNNTVQVTRVDTGEVVSTRAMTTSERQLTLIDDAPKPAAEVGDEGVTTTKKSRRRTPSDDQAVE